ncbi:MAG: HAMP domain-containing protein [Deltaproteobacteria bacterium]|nr:HAMP domain-containing protein [Deltaproteobacteria bacterium]
MKWLLRKVQVGLRTEIVLNIAILIVASLLLIGFTILKVSEKEVLEQKIAGGHIVLSSLQRGVAAFQGERWYQDPSLSRILIGFTQLREVEGIWIVDRDLRSLITRGRGGRYGEDLRKAIAQRTEEVRVERRGTLWWSFYRRLILTAPLIKGGRVIGGVQVSFSLADVTERLVVFRRLVLILILLDSLVLVTFGSFLLARVVVNPLKRLVEVAQQIREGELDQRAQVEYENEIGQLAKTFNQMVERLAEKQRDLEASIKKLKETQEELLLSEKLALVGRLAAGVAHEIGNPLTSVLGHTEILRKKLRDDEILVDLVERTRKETERIHRIIKDLLQFSRSPSSQIEDIDVNLVIQDSLNLVTVQKGFKDIAIDLSLRDDLPPVRGNSDQLQQVMVNILINAADAMPQGGSISIRTEEEKDGWVTISIKDTGEGIPTKDLDKVFDPFYTTKSPDKGTGLGLSISLKIIEDFGGRLKVESKRGKGAKFIIFLKKGSG